MLNYHKCWNHYKKKLCLTIVPSSLLWVLSIYPFIKHYTIVVSIKTIQFSHKYEKQYHWNAVQAFDMQHRASLSRKSVNFTKVDFTLQAQVDATAIKKGAPRCHRCRSADHHVPECPFPSPHPKTKQVVKNTWHSKIIDQ